MRNRNMDYSVKTSRSSDDKLTVTIGSDLEKLWQLRFNERTLEDWVRRQMLMLGGVELEDGRVTEVSKKHITPNSRCPHCANPVYKSIPDHGTQPPNSSTMAEFLDTLPSSSVLSVTNYFKPLRKSAAAGLAVFCTSPDIGLKAAAKIGGINFYYLDDLAKLVLPVVDRIVSLAIAQA